MLLQSVLCVLLSWGVIGSCQTIGYFYQNGQTRVLGSSFGLLGTNATFDYVIIGGGTSGLTMAKRLTEDSSTTVAVIEAGSFYELDNGNLSQVFGYDVYGSLPTPTEIDPDNPTGYNPLVDWGLVTVPQPQLNNRLIHYTQGKTLGGGSARNYLAYHRSSKGSYQKWSEQVGDTNYTFDRLLPYFQKSVNFTPPNYTKRGPNTAITYDSSAFSSSGGPLHVSYTNFVEPFSQYIAKGFEKLGLKEISGFNTGNLLGYSEFTSTLDPSSGLRSSAETSMLQTGIAAGPNFIVYQRTYARQIMFDSTKKATAVKVSTENVNYVLSAKKEVILAAGVFRSPQMLMVSGIGPAAILKQNNIKPVSVLEGVGQNMQDQPLFGSVYQINTSSSSQTTTSPKYKEQAIADLLTNQTGPLQSPNGNWVGWEKIPQALAANMSKDDQKTLSTFPSDWPDLELLVLGSTGGADVPDKSANYAEVSIVQLSFTSRGNVTIKSNNTQDNPIISPNWLSTEFDQQLAIRGLRRARQVAASWGITQGPEIVPGPNVQTDAQILAYLKGAAGPIHHASATCAMGKKGDPNAVVDSNGKVFGVSGLRIIDASTFPFLVPGHIQASVYMLAEKHAAAIKAGQ